MEDHREKDKRVEEDAMRRFFSSQPTGFICPILNGPCSTMTEAEEIEADLCNQLKTCREFVVAVEQAIGSGKSGNSWGFGPWKLPIHIHSLWERAYHATNNTGEANTP